MVSRTSSRSNDAGSVWVTRCSEKSRALASARRPRRSRATECWRSASPEIRRVYPAIRATSTITSDHCDVVRIASVLESSSMRNGMLTASEDRTLMRIANPNPRANPATVMAVSSVKTKGESQ